MFTVGLGLLGATVIIMIFQNTSSAILIGFGFGGSLLALFLRVGGGIFTKAADVGADLVGKVEQGIPEDDPRNPATIADNVGDNVGDCAGMASDLFESYEVTLVASIILGVAAFASIGANPALGLIFPVIVRAIGVLASIVGVYRVRAHRARPFRIGPDQPRLPHRRHPHHHRDTCRLSHSMWATKTGTRAGRCSARCVTGLILAQVASRITEYFTSTENAPVREIAKATETGPATTVLSGVSSGLESSVWAIIAIAGAIGVSIVLGGGNIQFSLYLVALCGMGMLATTGVVVSEDTFGPVADNAAGIAEMSGEFTGEAEKIMVSLDAVGNTTKAVTKGFAIGSAVIASVALFASFIETIAAELGLEAEGSELFRLPETSINVADPTTFIGLLLGGSIAFMFSAMAIRAVGKTAGVVVQEVRRQFADGAIMRGDRRPDYGPVIDICTAASLRELVTPALLAVLTPVIVGFGIGYLALGRIPGGVDPHRPAHGQLPLQLGWGLGQRQEVHRGRPSRRQGVGVAQGGGDRRHGRRPVQGHRRAGPQPADQGDEPDLAAGPAGGDRPPGLPGTTRHRRGGDRRADRRHRLVEALLLHRRSSTRLDRRLTGQAGTTTTLPRARPSPTRARARGASSSGWIPSMWMRTSPEAQRAASGSKEAGPGLTISSPSRRPVSLPTIVPIVTIASNVGTGPPTQR